MNILFTDVITGGNDPETSSLLKILMIPTVDGQYNGDLDMIISNRSYQIDPSFYKEGNENLDFYQRMGKSETEVATQLTSVLQKIYKYEEICIMGPDINRTIHFIEKLYQRCRHESIFTYAKTIDTDVLFEIMNQVGTLPNSLYQRYQQEKSLSLTQHIYWAIKTKAKSPAVS